MYLIYHRSVSHSVRYDWQADMADIYSMTLRGNLSRAEFIKADVASYITHSSRARCRRRALSLCVVWFYDVSRLVVLLSAVLYFFSYASHHTVKR